MRLRISEIEDFEVDEAVSLHNTEYRTERTSKQWLWEYRGNYPEFSVFAVIKDDKRIIGTQGMIPIYLNGDGRKLLTGKSENTLLDREYRGRGLAKQLYSFALSKCKEKGMYCIWGFTDRPDAVGLLSRLGFACYNNVACTVTLVLNIRKLIPSILASKASVSRRIARSLLSLPLYLYSRLPVSHPRRTSRQFLIRQHLKAARDVEDLYERLRKKHPDLIHIEQDAKYISWRVLSNPNFRYLTYFIYERDALRAYCYVSLADPQRNCISDLIFEDFESGDLLLGTVLASFRKRQIASIAFLGNVRNSLIASVFCLLKKHRFVKHGQLSFILKTLSEQPRQSFLNIDNWCLSGLWTEGYKF
ncbi:GNAT family N-acetyltransferase [Candidatus Bathyarchaeota archaeon]|nr:GNAT family N-acetyltransferase [Candidatus Bathyarchaeota archaeon]